MWSATNVFVSDGSAKFFQQCAFAWETQIHKPCSHAMEMPPIMDRLALKVLQELQ